MNKQKILNILKNTAAIVVILAMFVVVFYQNRDRDIFKFGKEESSDFISAAQENESAFSEGDIGRLKEKVAFLSTTAFTVVDKEGNTESYPVAMSKPQLHTEGEWAVCYEVESKELTVFKEKTQAYSVSTDNKIISAKINKNGYLFTATEKEGYNCECMVYNKSGEAIFKWDVSKSEFLDGDVNSSNSAIAITLASAGDKKLLGEVFLIDITTAEIIEKETFDSQIFYSLNFNNNDTYTLLGNTSLAYFNSDGTKRWEYGFGKKTLVKADVSNHDTMVLAFSSSGTIVEGSSTDVKIINKLGKVVAEKTYDEMIDALSQNKDAVALAFGKKIYVENGKLKEKKTIEADYIVKQMVLYEDSKHVFVVGNSGGKVIE